MLTVGFRRKYTVFYKSSGEVNINFQVTYN